MFSRKACFGVFLFFCLFPALRAEAATPETQPYKVGVFLQDRFVEQNSDGSYTGLEIELWEKIAKTLNLEFTYVPVNLFPQLLQELKDGQVDIGLGTIDMNRERADYIDFTHSYFVASLGILTKSKKKNTLFELLRPLLEPVIVKTIILFFVVTFVFGNFLWFMERKRHTIITEDYFPGIFQAMWCCFAIQSTIGFGDIIPNRWIARLVSIPIWICGLFLVAIITAQLLAFYTSEQYLSPIQSYNDLRGKTIVVIEGTVAARIADGIGAKKIIQVKDDLQGIYPEIEKGKIDAMIADYPRLADIFSNLQKEGKNPFLLPQHFYPELYAIAIGRKISEANPKLVEDINLEILTLRDDSVLERLKDKWFGDLLDVMK